MPAKRSSPGLVGSPPSEITVVLTFGSYEIGTNPLFDDRTEDRILHDPLIRSQLSKQKPDRVYGLQATKNFDQLLSKTASGSLGAIDGTSVGEIVRSSPFKEGTEPLLFPFLILEAKSESSSNGFGDIQIQTAFPIFALLKLQEDLQAQATESESGVAPLVWFFANRGDAWRIYGCFVSNSETSRYVRVRLFPLRLWSDPDKLILIQNVVQLWDGSIMSKDIRKVSGPGDRHPWTRLCGRYKPNNLGRQRGAELSHTNSCVRAMRGLGKGTRRKIRP
jgi:hypothetical protein